MDQILELPSDVNNPAAHARSRRSRGSRLARLTVFLVSIALAGGGGYYAWRTWAPRDIGGERFITAPVQRGDLEDAVTATGTLQPRDYVDVGTQVSGQLKLLHVAIGSTVKEGDLLAEIDPTVYQSKVDADQAQLRNQQAQLTDKLAQRALAEQQLTRQRNLMTENATTTEALQTAEAALASVSAQIEALRAQMQQTESSLRGDLANVGYTKIYAPMSGTVVSLPARQGQTLNANQQAPLVLRIADLSVMTVQAQVSEADVPKLRLGMEVYFTTLGGNDRRWVGRLRQVNPTPNVVNNVVLYDALFDVPNPAQELMTQMTAQVFFLAASAKDAVYVPLTALRPLGAERRRRGPGGPGGGGKGEAAGKGEGGQRAGGGPGAQGGRAAIGAPIADPRAQFASGRATVRVVKEDGAVEEREVKVGMMNRVSAQILEGLEPGEQVQLGARASGTAPRANTTSTGAPKFGPRI